MEIRQVSGYLLLYFYGIHRLLVALARVLDARLVLVLAYFVSGLGTHWAIALCAEEDARQLFTYLSCWNANGLRTSCRMETWHLA